MYKNASNFNQAYRPGKEQTKEDHTEPEPLLTLEFLERKRKRGQNPRNIKFKTAKNAKIFTGVENG